MWASQVVQWSRIHLPVQEMQETRVRVFSKLGNGKPLYLRERCKKIPSLCKHLMSYFMLNTVKGWGHHSILETELSTKAHLFLVRHSLSEWTIKFSFFPWGEYGFRDLQTWLLEWEGRCLAETQKGTCWRESSWLANLQGQGTFTDWLASKTVFTGWVVIDWLHRVKLVLIVTCSQAPSALSQECGNF